MSPNTQNLLLAATVILGMMCGELEASTELTVLSPPKDIKVLTENLRNLKMAFTLALIKATPVKPMSEKYPLADFLKKSIEVYPPTAKENEELKEDIAKMKKETEDALAENKKKQQLLNRFSDATKSFKPASTAVNKYASDKTDKNWAEAGGKLVVLVSELDKYITSNSWSEDIPSVASRRAISSLNLFKESLGIPTEDTTSLRYNGIIKRLETLSTTDASKKFIARSLKLEKASMMILDSEEKKIRSGIASYKFSEKSEKKFLGILSEWTLLWEDMAIYYSEFTPKNTNELYGEHFAKLLASMTEAAVVGYFIGLRFSSTDHLKTCIEIAELRISILKIAAETNIPTHELKANRWLKSFKLPDKVLTLSNGVDASKYFDKRLIRCRNSLSDRKDPPFSAIPEDEFRSLLSELSFARVSVGNYLDKRVQVKLDDVYRIGLCLKIVECQTIYLLEKTRSSDWATFGLQVAETRLQSAKANAALLEDIIEWKKKQKK